MKYETRGMKYEVRGVKYERGSTWYEMGSTRCEGKKSCQILRLSGSITVPFEEGNSD
jgi:hypothetical protein